MEKIYGEKGVILPEKLVIPEIDNKRLAELYKILKPIVTIDTIKYLLKEYTLTQIRAETYIYNCFNEIERLINFSELEIVEDFLCLHYSWSGGYGGSFKPSIAEILSQVPEKSISEANVFEIIEKPETIEDKFRYQELVDKHLHLSKVRTYKLK